LAEQEEHHSALPYFAVWIALIILTVTTYVTGQMHVGKWALPLALAIAVTKSLLVILIFMHLWEQKGANRLVISTSFVFGTDLPTQLEEAAPEHQPPPGRIGEPKGVPQPK
jgi:caa(3)-type oxidase subunit IV